MTNIEKIYRKLAKKYNLSRDTINSICGYEFKFTLNKINDIDDHKDILLHHLFKFKCKKRFK